jgi:hypothetical protein
MVEGQLVKICNLPPWCAYESDRDDLPPENWTKRELRFSIR